MTAITNVSITDERDLSGLAITAGGTLLNVRSFTANSTYTPTPGTTSVIVEAIGGGGSGGGSAATASGQMSAGGGGGAGAYARGRFTSGFAGVTVTVAAGVAAGAAGVSGQEGNSSSFGSLMTAPGGYGGQAGAAVSTPSITWGSNGSALPVGANIVSGSGEGGALALSSTRPPQLVVGAAQRIFPRGRAAASTAIPAVGMLTSRAAQAGAAPRT